MLATERAVSVLAFEILCVLGNFNVDDVLVRNNSRCVDF